MFDFIAFRPAQAKQKPEIAIILCHGVGSNPEALRTSLSLLQLPHLDRIEFILPRAPSIPLTLAQGQPLTAWFNLFEMSMNSVEDMVGIHHSVTELESLVHHIERQGIDLHNVFVGGFSQGGALALRFLFNSRLQIGGVIALSAYLPLRHTQPRTCVHSAPPVFLSHGTNDAVIPFPFAETSASILKRHGFDVTLVTSPTGHNLDSHAIKHLNEWFSSRLYADTR